MRAAKGTRPWNPAACPSRQKEQGQQRSRLTVPFLGRSSAARSDVGETRFAHATVLRAVPTECPLRAEKRTVRRGAVARLSHPGGVAAAYPGDKTPAASPERLPGY